MIKAIKVEATNNFEIIVTLEDNRIMKMDLNYIKNLKGPVIDPLKEIESFKKVFIRNGVVTWTTGYDIDPYFLVQESTQITKTA